MELKKRLQAGELTMGIMLSELYTPNLARLLSTCGFDFLLIDCEHGYFDYTQVANLIAVADGVNLPVLVRVARGSHTCIARYLDMGARGVLLANVENAEQAQRLVERCLYAPDGDRGVSTFRAHTGYQNGDVQAMLRAANESNIVICQVESRQAVASVEEIASVKGVDGLLVGPNDLTQNMGILGQYGHPEVLRAMERVAGAARRYGKWSGVITSNDGLLSYGRGLGMSCYSAGSELNALVSGAVAQRARAMEAISAGEA